MSQGWLQEAATAARATNQTAMTDRRQILDNYYTYELRARSFKVGSSNPVPQPATNLPTVINMVTPSSENSIPQSQQTTQTTSDISQAEQFSADRDDGLSSEHNFSDQHLSDCDEDEQFSQDNDDRGEACHADDEGSSADEEPNSQDFDFIDSDSEISDNEQENRNFYLQRQINEDKMQTDATVKNVPC